MRPSPPGSGTLFITQPQAKKKPSPSAQESGAQQNLLVHTRASPHRQAHASVLTVAATLECCYRLIDGKGIHRREWYSCQKPNRAPLHAAVTYAPYGHDNLIKHLVR